MMNHRFDCFISVVYKKDLSHFRTLQIRHQQNETNKEKTNFKGSMMNKKSYPSDIQFDLDAYHRPQQKIALLCGSPGAGVRCLLIESIAEYSSSS